MKLPTDYDLVINANGYAVLPRDFVPCMSVSSLTDDWASLTVKFRPFFPKKKGMGGGADACGRNNKANRDRWRGEIKDVIFGKKFKDNMTHGWNLGLA